MCAWPGPCFRSRLKFQAAVGDHAACLVQMTEGHFDVEISVSGGGRSAVSRRWRHFLGNTPLLAMRPSCGRPARPGSQVYLPPGPRPVLAKPPKYRHVRASLTGANSPLAAAVEINGAVQHFDVEMLGRGGTQIGFRRRNSVLLGRWISTSKALGLFRTRERVSMSKAAPGWCRLGRCIYSSDGRPRSRGASMHSGDSFAPDFDVEIASLASARPSWYSATSRTGASVSMSKLAPPACRR
ncbi:hypothetical protein D3C71_22650 [compost metagenome]